MELQQLRHLVAVTQQGSFRRAAQSMHIAQPSLSQQIRRLEIELGVILFDRDRRPVELTEAGRALVWRATRILEEADLAETELRDFGSKFEGSVSVGSMHYLTHLELPELLVEFRRERPRADLRLRVGTTAEVQEMLVNGEVDVALIHAGSTTLPANYVISQLRIEPLVVIAAHDDALVAQPNLKWTDLRDRPFILFREGARLRAALAEVTAKAGFLPHATLESGDIAAAVTLVARGLGLALVPLSLAEHEEGRVSILDITDESLSESLVIAHRSRDYVSRAQTELIRLAHKQFASRPSRGPLSSA